MIMLLPNELKPGMVISKDLFDSSGQLICTKGTLLTVEVIENIQHKDITEVKILDIEKLKKNREKQTIVLKNRINDIFTQNQDTLSDLITFRKYLFHSVVRRFLLPYMVGHTESLQVLVQLESVISGVLDAKHLVMPITNLLNLSLDTDKFKAVMACSLLIGLKMGLSNEQLADLAKASLFYNYGYFELLSKRLYSHPNQLLAEMEITEEERREHVKSGYYAILQFENEQVALVACEHHERFAGDGFPMNKCGEEISLLSRIVAVSKTFVSMQCKRRNRPQFSNDRAFDYIITNAGIAFDPEVVEAFRYWFCPYPVGRMVELSDGSVGIIARQDEQDPYHPIVYMTGPKSFYLRAGQLIMLRSYKELSISKLL